jgi:PAS domain S-box-containing protein
MPIDDHSSNNGKLKKEIEELHKQAEYYRRLASIPELDLTAIMEFDRHGKTVYLNPAAQKTLSTLGLTDAHIFLPDDFTNIRKEITARSSSQALREKCLDGRIFKEVIVYSPEYNSFRVFVTEITGQKQAEAALEHSKLEMFRIQEFLEAAIKGTRVLIATVDNEYRYTYFNQAYKDEVKLLSRRDVEIGMSMLEVFDHLPEQRRVVEEEWSQVLEGKSTNKVLTFGDPGLHQTTYNVFHTPLWDDKHMVVGAGEVAYDLTEQTRMETALQESEGRYRTLFESMTEGFAIHEMIYDQNGNPYDYRFLDINPAFERLTGLTSDMVIGKTYREVMPQEGDRWVNYYGKVVTAGESAQFEEFSPTLNKYYEVFAYRYAQDQFATIFLDISEQKRMENDLRTNLTKYSVLFNALPLGVTITDNDGHIVESNQEASRILDLSQDDLNRRYIQGEEWKIIRPDGSPMPAAEFASVRAMQEHKRIENIEMGIIKPDEHVTWISVTAAPLPLKEYGIVIAYNDITRRIQAEAELHQAHDKLEMTIHQRTRELQNANKELKAEIEERKRAESKLVIQSKALEAERQRFNDVLEILPVYTVLLTPDYHVAFANRYFRDRFGEDNGRRCYEYLFGLSEPCENCEKFKVLQTKKLHRWDWIGPDQHKYDVFDFPFKDSNGSALILELGIDITERLKAEDKLRGLNAYNRSLIEANLDALVTITPDGKIGDVNSVTEAITGYERDELIGKDFHSYFTDPERARVGYQRVFETGMVRDYELEIQHRDGHTTPVTYNASVYCDETGKVAGVFAAARDITEHKQAEEALRKSEEQYRSLVIATSQIVWQTDANGQVVEDIPTWREYTGQSLEECMGQGWINAVHPEDQERVAEVWASAVEKKANYAIEYRVRNCFGEYGDFSVRGVPIIDKDGFISSWVGTCTDITEKKKYENQLIQAEKHAIIGRMVGSVTHEINNPLQTIKNCLYLLQQDLQPDSICQEPLDMAHSETQRLSNIVGQLRQLYRPQTTQTVTKHRLSGIISEVKSLIAHHLTNLHVEYRLSPEIKDYSINCVREQLIEVFLNICTNAIEAMQPGGGTLSLNTVFSSDKGQVGVVISDTGPGIAPEILPHIFEPFITTKESGLGLGLSITYGIVQKHGGQITVESQLGQGTSFTIWLPIVS